ncbi:hypothetical protein CABS03_02882 [Colletotrichum abscissum]|uniref:Uncharacterized protein n=1 Tax=Colletotrichum abscissum TaxID=1671311 RepID=A0A9P9XK96_9PEZI|nr:hypothetical protein CABS02_04409 [Colletotrichum abscissum]
MNTTYKVPTQRGQSAPRDVPVILSPWLIPDDIFHANRGPSDSADWVACLMSTSVLVSKLRQSGHALCLDHVTSTVFTSERSKRIPGAAWKFDLSERQPCSRIADVHRQPTTCT